MRFSDISVAVDVQKRRIRLFRPTHCRVKRRRVFLGDHEILSGVLRIYACDYHRVGAEGCRFFIIPEFELQFAVQRIMQDALCFIEKTF